METLNKFPRSCRLGGRGTFNRIRDAGVRDPRGPITVWAIPNDVAKPRMGISIGRHVGNAVRRNRIKRLLRESFRLMQGELPCGYDFLVSVKRHEPLALSDYQRMLSAAMSRLDDKWKRRPRGEDLSCDG